ncbi:MAG: hypothetical protein ACO1TE_00275 [Prosthecobacter sp.]
MKPIFTSLCCCCCLLVPALLVSCKSSPTVSGPVPGTPTASAAPARQKTAADREHLEGQITEAMRTLVPGYRDQPLTYTTPTGKRTFTPKPRR